jgi:two-component system sensor histidine kinase/response regulator
MQQVEQEIPRGKVLIVDDNPLILETLNSILRARDYEVIRATDGIKAMKLLQQDEVDVVISDVMMPSCDGYQFYENVRSENKLAHVPFIFLTALDDVKEISKGNQSGCDCYLTKPFDPYLLLSTVEGKIARSRALKQVMQETQDNYRRRVVQTLSHEFRTPLVAINTGSEILKEQAHRLDQAKVKNLIEAIYRGGQRLERLVQDFMTLQHIEAGMAAKMASSKNKRTSIRRLAKDFYESFKDEFESDGKRYNFIETGCDGIVLAFEAHIQDILLRFTQNAFKFSPCGEYIEIWCEDQDSELAIVIADRGQGLSAKQAQGAIDAFRQLNRDKIEQQGAGLGLYIADSLARCNGASIHFEERQGGGTLASIRFKEQD